MAVWDVVVVSPDPCPLHRPNANSIHHRCRYIAQQRPPLFLLQAEPSPAQSTAPIHSGASLRSARPARPGSWVLQTAWPRLRSAHSSSRGPAGRRSLACGLFT